LAAYLPTRVAALRMGLPAALPGAGTVAGAGLLGCGSPGRERGGGRGNCRGGCLIARRFAGARVVGRWLCIAIFEGNERLL